ncbi:uncharacterized protein I303_105779 [Kwoniella dejecticola CBS 10117]|uniref:DUF7330 domain-containing protein n=1 Tax=Kwoniella dejecticola CBS 10117 TaxID=1296121 RepID=A0A1A6A0F1_9TREE|nr:uncharacterized protein I303_05801 [Kwoniella dejecticola CBS 10117]OBR83521.1 hypothetical protein I303_05801 [Kwoniella dejecticola CBS 10117]
MALPSTYQLRHSLPNRSPTQRPRSLSLSEYQPLNFDRDALESAYQASLNLPSSHASSWTGHSNSQSFSFNGASTETHDTSMGSGEDLLTHPKGAFAGVGSGHTLTPPQSPLHKATTRLNQASLLSPIPSSSNVLQQQQKPPTPPPRPNDTDIPETTFKPSLPPRQPPRPSPPNLPMRRSQSEVDMMGHEQWDGAYEWIEGDGRGRGKRRALPPVPTNVPVPEPPQWEPDYKPQIPSDLTAPSAQYAYASLSAPPPNLPPRRHQRVPSHQQNGMGSAPNLLAGPSNAGTSSSTSSRPPISTGASIGTVFSSASSSSNTHGLPMSPPAGAPDFPPDPNPPVVKPQKRDAEKEVLLRAQDRMLIWSTHYLDPTLKESILHVPHQVTNAANVALSGLSSGPKTRYDSTIGAPIDGLAKMAKEWVVTPDARFLSEHGGIELGLGIINSHQAEEWAKDKGRKKARVEVISRSGGIKVDILELDQDRQVDLKIETKSGDVLVLLPNEFHGPIHITSSRPPEPLSIISPLLKPISNPYSSFYTTFMVPLSLSRDAKRSNSAEYDGAVQVEKIFPNSLKEQSDLFDQLYGGFASHSRIDHSKITIKSDKGRVVLGLRDSKDEVDLEKMGLRVGVKGGEGKKRRWWRM